MQENVSCVDNSVRMYMREMGSIPMLTLEEEVELTSKAAAGDEDAKNKLVSANLRLVMPVVKHYMGCGVPFLDLIQEGNIGLMKAADRFDPNRGYRFSTYATWWIKQTVSRAVADQSRTIRIPAHMTETINKVKRKCRELAITLQRDPTPADVAYAMNMDEADVKNIFEYMNSIASLDAPVGDSDGDEEVTIASFIADPNFPDPAVAYDSEDMRMTIEKVLATLSPREAEVIRLRFGLGTGKPMTLEEVGEHFSLTRERIRQIEAKAFQKLRHPSRAKMLKECLI